MATTPPAGFHSVTPYLFVDDVAAQLDFLAEAFDAEVTERLEVPGGGIMHAEVQIGDSRIMMGGARPEWPAMPASIYLYVEGVDGRFQKALDAGAEVVEAVKNQFYGDRSGGVRDPQGNLWWIATHVEDVSLEEIQRRMAEMG